MQEQLVHIASNLQDLGRQLDTKNEEVKLMTETERSKDERLIELSNELTKQKSIKESLREKLGELNSRNAAQEEKIKNLEDNLNRKVNDALVERMKTLQDNLKDSNKTFCFAQAEEKQTTAIIEAKLSALTENQEKAESRGHQASVLAKEGQQDLHKALNKMTVAIDSTLLEKELTSRHNAEMKIMLAEVEMAKSLRLEESVRFSENVNRLTAQTEVLLKKLNMAEDQVKRANRKLEQKSLLQTEVDQHSSTCLSLKKDIKSLNTTIEYLKKSKDDSEQSIQLLKTKLEDERHRHANTVINLEKGIRTIFETTK